MKTDYNILCSIDIGLNGAISYFDTVSDQLLSIYPMPTKNNINGKRVLDVERLRFFLEIPKVHKDSCIVVFEDVHAFPGQGVVSIGTLLFQKGVITGMAEALGYSQLPISPKEWQKYFGIVPSKDLKGNSAKATKALRKKWLKTTSMEKAKEFYKEFETKIVGDGVSDSMLIGRWYLETQI